MSRKIFKQSREKVRSTSFQFQSTMFDPMGGGEDPSLEGALEAEAELEAFDREPAHHHQMSVATAQNVDVSEIIARGQEDADAIVEAAQQKAAEIEREAYEKGLVEGRKTGEIMAEQQLQAILTQYHHGLTTLDGVRDLMINQMQLDLLDLVVHTAQKVVNEELQLNPQTILAMLKGAIQSLKQRKNLTIFLNGDDHQFVMSMAENEKQKWFGTQVQIEIDAGLSRGSFRIETPAGELDANIEERLGELYQELRQALEKQ